MARRSQNKAGKRVFLDGKMFWLIVNFSPGITETAKAVLEAIKTSLPVP